MKLTVKHLAGLLSAVFLLLLCPYFFKFHHGFSGDSQDWANFGTYIGGTLGPIGAFLAFWGLMQQNKMYRDNAEVERLVIKTITLDSEITSLAMECKGQKITRPNAYLHNNEIDLKVLLHYFDKDSAMLILNKKEDKVLTYIPQFNGTNYFVLQSIAGKLNVLNDLLKQLSKLAQSTEILHFNEKYQFLLKEMQKKEWIEFDSFGS